MPRTSWLAVLCLFIALAVTVRVEEHRVGEERARVATLALQAANVAAERDSTRDVALTNQRVAALLGDSLRAVERLVVQRRQETDALDRASGAERRGRYRVAIGARALDVIATATPARDSSSEVRRARFSVREEPYTVLAEVSVPAPPDSASMKLHVALDSIRLEARVSCSAPDGNGVRAASLSTTGPRWAPVAIGRVEQAAEICNPPREVARNRGWLRVTPLVAGVGRMVTAKGDWAWGVFLGVGVRVWG